MTDMPMGVLFSQKELDDISQCCSEKAVSLYDFVRYAVLDEVCK